MIPALEKALTLKPRFIEAAKKTLDGIITKHLERHNSGTKKKKIKKKKITFIGIHSRRTDHLAFEREKGMVSLKPSYFIKAMDMYR